METPATYEDVNLILKLYDMRREEKLREARKWFGKFHASTMAEREAMCPPGSEADAFFRMVVTYWEMAASFITSGVLHQELFLQSGNELLFVWEKVRDFVPEWRTAAKPVVQTWANAVKKTGTDPEVALKDLKAQLTKYNSGY